MKEIQIPPEGNPSFFGRKSKLFRKEIQIKSFHFLCRIEPFQRLTRTPTAFLCLKPIPALGRRVGAGVACLARVFRWSLLFFGSSGLLNQAKGWRRLDRGWRPCERAGAVFRPTFRPRSLAAKKGTAASTDPGVKARGPAERQADRSDVRHRIRPRKSPIRGRAFG
jgi:hypothetical protein